METLEHVEVGDLIQYVSTANNPYVTLDENNVLNVRLMRFENGMPVPLKLTLSAGKINALSGDFYSKPGWAEAMDLDDPKFASMSHVELGRMLIDEVVRPEEEKGFIDSYDRLASERTRECDIKAIFAINNSKIIPFSDTLNGYFKQLMFYVRVRDYGKNVDKNEAHFSPWGLRAYIIGHSLALRMARVSYELRQLANNPHVESTNPDALHIFEFFKSHPSFFEHHALYQETLIDISNRYHAMAVAMSLHVGHYYSDIFAAGHTSRMGFLRTELPKHLGSIFGGLLVNSQHNEDNKNGVWVWNHYDPNPEQWYPNPATGDGDFNKCQNVRNRANCIKGMSLSLAGIEAVRQGRDIPAQQDFQGLETSPDVDMNARQTKPMFILWQDKIYVRRELKKTNIISPLAYQKLMSENPEEHGYREVEGKWDAFKLVIKTRVLGFYYNGKVKPLTPEEDAAFTQEERQLNPNYDQNHIPPCTHAGKHPEPKTHAVNRHGLFNCMRNLDLDVPKEDEMAYNA